MQSQASTCSARLLNVCTCALQGMLLHVFCMVGAGSMGVICYAMLLIIRPSPWWHAQYFIPTLGMLLGNCISGVSVGLSSVMEELTTGHTLSVADKPFILLLV